MTFYFLLALITEVLELTHLPPVIHQNATASRLPLCISTALPKATDVSDPFSNQLSETGLLNKPNVIKTQLF